ncbi:hypothetical protein IGJ32_000501 [Enterococcus sp. DIV1639a]
MGRPIISVQKVIGYDLQLWELNEKQIGQELSTSLNVILYTHTQKREDALTTFVLIATSYREIFLYSEPDSPSGYMNDSELILYKYDLKEGEGSWLVLNRSISPDYFYLRRCSYAI